MTVLEKIIGTELTQAAVDAFPDALDEGLVAGAVLVDRLTDPVIKAALSAALGALSTPEARATLVQVAGHEVVAFATFLGLGLTGAARTNFIGNPNTSFEERHALLEADDTATRQETEARASVVSSLEALLVEVLAKGGAAALPLLMAIF